MGGAGPQLQPWESEQSEAYGISFSTHQSPHVASEHPIPAAETAPAAGVNVVVVVDGNCILQYTHRDAPCHCLCHRDTLMTHQPPPCYGAIDPCSPPVPPPIRSRLSHRARGLRVRCCAEFCLEEEEEWLEQRPRPQGATPHSAPSCQLMPVPVPRSPTGPWFTMEASEDGRRGARVARIWDRGHCPLLEEGDLVAKVNGADVRGLGPQEVESVLQQHMRAGDVILLVERRGAVLHAPPLEHLFSISSPCQGSPQAGVKGGPQGSLEAPSGDSLAITSFVGPEPCDMLLCPAHCRQGETWRTQCPQPTGDPGVSGGSVALDGTKRASGGLVPGHSRDPSSRKPQEDRGLLSRIPHPELRALFRQAGAKVRLRMLPPPRNTVASSDLDAADIEVDEGAGRLGCRLPQPQCLSAPWDPPSYSVELLRGPLGFGLSLRGGSEYNMDIYVLGLMEGGPAQQSGKIQVSDQLIEINGEPTLGMTHARAVEQIRCGGSRICLVLKKGNGFVPDYDFGHMPSPARQEHMTESGVAPGSWRADPIEGSPCWGQDNGCCLEASPSSAKQGSHHCHQHRSQKLWGTKQGQPPSGQEAEAGKTEHASLSPQREQVWRGLSDPAPGPWLVPSKERLSRALRGVCMVEGEEDDDTGGSVEWGKGGEVKKRT